MPSPIQIVIRGNPIDADLANTNCGKEIAKLLPIENKANRWGEEIYFDIGLKHPLDETALEIVQLGDIGFWPTGNAICFFFGKTPISVESEIRPASAVNIVGKIHGNLDLMKEVKEGERIIIQAKE